MVESQPYKFMKQLNFRDPCPELDERKIKKFLLKLSFLGQQRETSPIDTKSHVCIGW